MNQITSYRSKPMFDEIILRPSGNTYCGELAHKFLFGYLELPKIFRLYQSDKFHVFECPEGENFIIHRASQSTREGAMKYMMPGRILITETEE